MRTWLTDSDAFDEESNNAGGPERAWQRLLESNPWVLGVGLGGQLLTSWNDQKLEQVTTGADATTSGKRVDALLRTNGIVRSMVFAEIKHHRTDLLTRTPYRSSCGAVAKFGRQEDLREIITALGIFSGRHFPREIILWAVRWYCRYGLSYRDLEEMMTERGVPVDHSTILTAGSRNMLLSWTSRPGGTDKSRIGGPGPGGWTRPISVLLQTSGGEP